MGVRIYKLPVGCQMGFRVRGLKNVVTIWLIFHNFLGPKLQDLFVPCHYITLSLTVSYIPTPIVQK